MSGSQGAAGTDAEEAPESIDNSDIAPGHKLRENLEEGKDFVIVSVQQSRVLLLRLPHHV